MARRQSIALIGSVILHGLPLVWGLVLFVPNIELPELEFEFAEVEMIDPNAIQSEEPLPPEPIVLPPEPSADSSEEGDAKEEPEPEPEPEKPEKQLGDRNSRVEQLGPTNATFYTLLVNKRVRKLPYADLGIEVMAPLPDFQFLVQGGEFNALHDFDYLVLASPDLRDVTQTFLAVEYKLPLSEMKAGVERAVRASKQVITWETRGGFEMGNPRPADPNRPDIDPRWVVFLDDKVAVMVREEFLPSIIEDSPNEGKKTAGNFVANLTRMRRFAAREPRAAMQIVLKDLHAALKGVKGLPFPVPNDIEVTIEADKNPEIAIKGEFLTPGDAGKFHKWFTEDLAAIVDDLGYAIKMVARPLYQSLEATQDGKRVVVRGKVTEDQAMTILKLIAGESRKMVRKTPAEMEANRLKREEAWRLRKGGKLTPSQAREAAAKAAGKLPPGDAGPPAPAPDEALIPAGKPPSPVAPTDPHEGQPAPTPPS